MILRCVISCFRSVATSSSAKKLTRRSQASKRNNKISKRGSIVAVPQGEYYTHEIKSNGKESDNDISHIPDEIKQTYDNLSSNCNGNGVSFSATVSWSVMQDAIGAGFISDAVMWQEFIAFLSESNCKENEASVTGNELLDMTGFYEFCMRLQRIIDTNIDMTESLK